MLIWIADRQTPPPFYDSCRDDSTIEVIWVLFNKQEAAFSRFQDWQLKAILMKSAWGSREMSCSQTRRTILQHQSTMAMPSQETNNEILGVQLAALFYLLCAGCWNRNCDQSFRGRSVWFASSELVWYVIYKFPGRLKDFWKGEKSQSILIDWNRFNLFFFISLITLLFR